MKSIQFLGTLLLSIFFLVACGNETSENTPTTKFETDSISLAKKAAEMKEISSRALLDRIADYQLLFSAEENKAFNIYIINGDGTGLRQLTDDKGSDMLPKWLPDASGFIFESDRNQKQFQAYLFSFSDSLYQKVGNLNFEVRSPSISIDNDIVFVSEKDKAKHIYKMDLNGKNIQKLTNTTYDDIYPVWSPDALSITFQTFRHDKQTDIYLCDRSGSNLIRVTKSNAFDYMPNWSPNGKELIYSSNGSSKSNNFDIFTIKANDTSTPKNISNTPDKNEMMPVFSADGEYIAYMLARGNKTGIHVMSVDGSTHAQVTPDYLAAAMPSWRPPTDIEKALEEQKPSSSQKVEIQIGN
ncbi:MAG: TolB family protein [Chitinophagales bacterium]